MNNNKIQESVENAFKQLNDIDENDTTALTNMALDFAMTANTYIQISKRILYLIRAYDAYEKAKEEREKRNKDKKEKTNETQETESLEEKE